MYLGKNCNSGQIADKPKFLQKEKPTKGFVKPNVSYAYGDPYGNRKSPVAICIFSKNQKNRIIEPFATHLKKHALSNFLRCFVTIKNKQRIDLRRVSAKYPNTADCIRGRQFVYCLKTCSKKPYILAIHQ